MIEGSVNEDYEATIQIVLRGTGVEGLEIEAIIDTGYTGHLTLPIALMEEMNLPWQGRRQVMLADGSIRTFDIYGGIVAWNGQDRPIDVDAVDTEPLVGMGLLRGHSLRVDVVRDGIVTVEALS